MTIAHTATFGRGTTVTSGQCNEPIRKNTQATTAMTSTAIQGNHPWHVVPVCDKPVWDNGIQCNGPVVFVALEDNQETAYRFNHFLITTKRQETNNLHPVLLSVFSLVAESRTSKSVPPFVMLAFSFLP